MAVARAFVAIVVVAGDAPARLLQSYSSWQRYLNCNGIRRRGTRLNSSPHNVHEGQENAAMILLEQLFYFICAFSRSRAHFGSGLVRESVRLSV